VLRVGGKMMMPADLKLDIERIDHISDEMRAVVESEWPELAQAATRKAVTATCRLINSPTRAGNRSG
jgi:hypothetical protein